MGRTDMHVCQWTLCADCSLHVKEKYSEWDIYLTSQTNILLLQFVVLFSKVILLKVISLVRTT